MANQVRVLVSPIDLKLVEPVVDKVLLLVADTIGVGSTTGFATDVTYFAPDTTVAYACFTASTGPS